MIEQSQKRAIPRIALWAGAPLNCRIESGGLPTRTMSLGQLKRMVRATDADGGATRRTAPQQMRAARGVSLVGKMDNVELSDVHAKRDSDR